MVRNYRRVTQRGSYGSEALTSALAALREGQSVKQTAREYGIPAKTLRRHRDGKVSKPGSSVLGRFSTVFSEEFESVLVKHITAMERALFGLTTKDMRHLAFDLAEKLNLKHPFSHNSKMAGEEWLRSFLKRHSEICIRNPQATSLSRAIGFNQAKVNQFFTVYGEVLQKGSYSASQIWNMDETGITNVHKPTKILATKGKKQVGKISSGEKGNTVTVICAMSAAGNYVPPFMIFPRKRMIDVLMKGSAPGSVGVASPNGWTSGDLFIDWLAHFVREVKCSKSDPCILILDGHQSHKTLQAIDMARDNGITIITLPPHCTHKMQPLDRTFFKSLKSRYNATCDDWMRSNAGKRISFFDMAELFGKAYMQTADVAKAVSGFSVCGIWPINSTIFSDEDFCAAELTDEPQPVNDVTGPQSTASMQPGQQFSCVSCDISSVPIDPIDLGLSVEIECSSLANAMASEEVVTEYSDMHIEIENSGSVAPVTKEGNKDSDADASVEVDSLNLTMNVVSKEVVAARPATLIETDNLSSTDAEAILMNLSPKPRISGQRTRKRRAESATNITASPYKKILMEKSAKKCDKIKEKNGMKQAVKKAVVKNVQNKQKPKSKKVTRHVPQPAQKQLGKLKKKEQCRGCGIKEGSIEDLELGQDWIACEGCDKWYHEECAEQNGIMDDDYFTCKLCTS